MIDASCVTTPSSTLPAAAALLPSPLKIVYNILATAFVSSANMATPPQPVNALLLPLTIVTKLTTTDVASCVSLV